ncbi:hypothetical protein K2Z83_22215 [Oscillochloris sp. ZM17-4]|uniref:hypothetical protein n=1 Tax=Oscillochloris sp. ZM17-4 TaxID=2866714 RepID=UPI001C72FA67|nr:hypothetical protein [Oscillochloris sp. ZM17-4]MBX0330379.1 hypothetical protein [Oscillochloris sp. ZM17-4]
MVALLVGCSGVEQVERGAPPAAPAALPQARAAMEAGEYAAAVALAGPWASTSDEAAGIVATAHMARAEAALRGALDSAEARRAAIDQLALAMAAAPEGELRERIAARMGEVAAEAAPTHADEAADSPATQPQAARPRPQAQPHRTYAVAQRKSFEGGGESGQFASCVDVQVIGRAGPVSDAVVEVNNGEHSYQSQTDAGGYAGRCGLGASTWSVVLFWTPGGGDSGVATTVYLSGAPEQRAAVVFQER